MISRSFRSSFFLTTLLTIVLYLMLEVAVAEVRSSLNYQIQSDSVNVGGGFSTSTSYAQESTVGEVATGLYDSGAYALRAGFQQMQEVFIGLEISNAVSMTPDLPGITGGTSTGSTTATVVTDGPAGYQLTITAENDPAMRSGINTIEDYDAGVDPDYSFLTSGSDVHLGYTPEGLDIVSQFRDDGAGICGQGGIFDTAGACWAGLSTTSELIAEGNGTNHPDGATTTIYFQVGIGSGVGVAPGVYTATTTITALPL